MECILISLPSGSTKLKFVFNLKNLRIGNNFFWRLNLSKILSSDYEKSDLPVLKPHDTIFVKQKPMSQFFTNSSLAYAIIGLINIAITLSQDN